MSSTLPREYLGEFPVRIEDTPFSDFHPEDWALLYIQRYGGFDGAHHKDWVLDQVTRILLGTEIEVTEARWSDGTREYRLNTARPRDRYHRWVAETMSGEDGPETYGYSEGTPP